MCAGPGLHSCRSWVASLSLPDQHASLPSIPPGTSRPMLALPHRRGPPWAPSIRAEYLVDEDDLGSTNIDVYHHAVCIRPRWAGQPLLPQLLTHHWMPRLRSSLTDLLEAPGSRGYGRQWPFMSTRYISPFSSPSLFNFLLFFIFVAGHTKNPREWHPNILYCKVCISKRYWSVESDWRINTINCIIGLLLVLWWCGGSYDVV
jgi:hypothetical protein